MANNISIRDKIGSINVFKDITYYYRILGKCVFQGYVPRKTLQGSGYADYGLDRYSDYSEYSSKGNVVFRKDAKIAKSVGNYITQNMYAEYPEINILNEKGIIDEKQTEELRNILQNNKFQLREKRLFETKLHIGDYVLKPYIEDYEIKIDYITGDRFFATKVENGQVVEGVFMTEQRKIEKRKTVTYYRLEWHYAEENDRIVQIEVYKVQDGASGWKQCSDTLGVLAYAFNEVIETNVYEFKDVGEPTFVLSSNPDQHNKDLESGRGIGFVLNYLDILMSINEAFDAKSKDNTHGSMQKLVPGSGLEEVEYEVNGKIRTIRHHDPADPEIFAYNDSENLEDSKPDAYAPTLRTEQHVVSMNTDLDMLSLALQLSAGTLRFDGKSIITATQVLAEKSDTARTIKEYERVNEDGWKDLFMLIQAMNKQELKKNTLDFKREQIEIIWKDNIIVDDESVRARDLEMVQAGYMPLSQFLMKHEGLEEKEAIKWVEQANKERFGTTFEEDDDNDDDDLDDDSNE